ncbi:MAG: hypothetical protein ACREBG_17680 [Pyrinomonadaceae bacterium]
MFRKSFFLLTILALAALLHYAQDEKKATKVTGYLIDNACATGLDAKDKEHMVSCSLSPRCVASGYAVVSKDTLYKLDDNGNKLALQVLRKTKVQRGLTVAAEGTIKDGILHVETMAEVPGAGTP